MPATIVLGTQWGDEGKGKAVDYLADGMDFVVRYQGGNNAGHTVIAEGRLLKLQLIPSGVLYPHITPVIADGVVIDPRHLLRELDDLRATGVDVSRLQVSGNCHLIMPYHLELEKVTQRFLGHNALGTTKRGIGPAYADKAARIGLRVQDLFDQKIFREKLEIVLREKNAILTKLYGRLPLDGDAIVEEYMDLAGRLEPYVADTSTLLHRALRDGKSVMLEGAQGTLLDLDKGTYPFVTSSNPVAGYALASAGFGPKEVERVVGIVKAYVTRVGAGPFPTEDLGEDGERLGVRGQEFGTVTGRKRRCGWLDVALLRYAARVNGLTELFLTKLDVLSGFERLPISTGYRVEGSYFDDFPPNQSLFHRAEPVYEELDGWMEEVDEAKTFEDLPKAAREYVRRIEELVDVPVSVVSVGPAREQSLPRRMKVLVVGGGGREHALCWGLARSPLVEQLHAAPGNAGIGSVATCHAAAADDVDAQLRLAEELDADLVVIGPEAPLVAGLADELRAKGRRAFGPGREGARLEGSKAFAKELMDRHGIATARAATYSRRDWETDFRDVLSFLDLELEGRGAVVKADGLAAGKGVTVTSDRAKAVAAIEACLADGAFGEAGERVVIEERLEGPEVSAFALVDASSVVPLALAQDFKRVGDGDTGPNTGGMGAYSPLPWLDPTTESRIWGVVSSTVRALHDEGIAYSGLLYTGVMLTEGGPKVLEYNCRFGDPETQVVIPRLRGDLAEMLDACATDRLADAKVDLSGDAAVAVVLASGGYPGPIETGRPIGGLDAAAASPDAVVFHSGTAEREGRVVTEGGRVLVATGWGPSVGDARDRAYEAASHISFDGMIRRGDIAAGAAEGGQERDRRMENP